MYLFSITAIIYHNRILDFLQSQLYNLIPEVISGKCLIKYLAHSGSDLGLQSGKQIKSKRHGPHVLRTLTLSYPEGYHPIRVPFQERHGAPYKVAKELPSLIKLPLLWIFESSFIDGLP
jgi:hypothetical protein